MSILNRNGPRTSRRTATTFFTWPLALLAHAGFATAALASPAPAQQIPKAIQSLAVPFEANSGQFDPGVAFMGKTFAGEIYVTRQGQIVYSLPGPLANGAKTANAANARQPGWSLTETLAGAQPLAPAGGAAAEAKINRFNGSHSHQSPGYRSVQLGQAWPGVSVELAARGSNVEKLFHVAPHADAAQIQVRLDGAQSLRLAEGGELIVTTGHGEVAYTAPVAFQMVAGQRVAVPVQYALNAAGGGYGFALGAYDAALPLVIDPLLQSTYLGGAGDDRISTLAIDKATGDVLVGGVTYGDAFPGVAGGAQTATGRSYEDGFVARLSGDLKTLRYSAILGGKGNDFVKQLAIDAVTGDVVVGGRTESADFPAIAGGAQPAVAGQYGSFVARLSGDLGTLQQSTVLGGSSSDSIGALAIDAVTGDVLVSGETYSARFPGTVGGAQPAAGSADQDGFVARLSGDLKTLRQSTYLGGSRGEGVFAISTDSAGDVLVGGVTSSRDFPGTAGGARPVMDGAGYLDGFVARLSGDLRTLRQSTYHGGQQDNWVTALAVDRATGNVVVGGVTQGVLSSAAGGAQGSPGGDLDGFVSQLSADLKTLRQSTYLGGPGRDTLSSLAIDATQGDVVVAGWVEHATAFPGTEGGLQQASHGWSDGFVARLSSDLKTLQQSTFLGGGENDAIHALVVDAATGDLLVAGGTASSDLRGTDGGAQRANAGRADGFVARLTGDLKADGNAKPHPLSPQKISFGQQAGRTFVAGTRFAIAPLATASSGLQVSYAAGTPDICTVSGETVTMVSEGTCTVVASQGGDAKWEPAADVAQGIVLRALPTPPVPPVQPPVVAKPQAISFPQQRSVAPARAGQHVVLERPATASSGLPVSYYSETPEVCRAAGGPTPVVLVMREGVCTLIAYQRGNAQWAPAPETWQNIGLGQAYAGPACRLHGSRPPAPGQGC